MKNRYLNFSAELKFATTQNEPKRAETKKCNPQPATVGSWKSRFKTLNLNVSGTNRDVAPKQRYDRFPSVGDHIHATPTFEHAWATPKYTVIGGS